MNNTVTPINNVNFQAKLNVAQIKGNKTRWQNIAKIFEEKTKQYTKDEVILSEGYNGRIIFERINLKKNWIENDAVLEPTLIEALKKLSDTEIAKKLATIFKFLKKEKTVLNKIDDLAKFMKMSNTSYETEYYDLMTNIRLAHSEEFKAKNPIFQKGLII